MSFDKERSSERLSFSIEKSKKNDNSGFIMPKTQMKFEGQDEEVKPFTEPLWTQRETLSSDELDDYDMFFEEDRINSKNKDSSSNKESKQIKYGMNVLSNPNAPRPVQESKYIEKMKRSAQNRKIEYEIAIERKIHKENKAQMDGETQVFITSEYKSQLEERLANRSILKERDEKADQTLNMNNFFSNLKNNVTLGGLNRERGEISLLKPNENKPRIENYYSEEYFNRQSRKEIKLNPTVKSKLLSSQNCIVKHKPRRNDEESIKKAQTRYYMRKGRLHDAESPVTLVT